MLTFTRFFKENTQGVVQYGFEDRGVFISRFTLITPDIKINQRGDHGIFEEEYNTIIYKTITDAANAFFEILKEEGQDVPNAKQRFVTQLLKFGTIVCYSYSSGNHFGESPVTYLTYEEGEWNVIENINFPDEDKILDKFEEQPNKRIHPGNTLYFTIPPDICDIVADFIEKRYIPLYKELAKLMEPFMKGWEKLGLRTYDDIIREYNTLVARLKKHEKLSWRNIMDIRRFLSSGSVLKIVPQQPSPGITTWDIKSSGKPLKDVIINKFPYLKIEINELLNKIDLERKRSLNYEN